MTKEQIQEEIKKIQEDIYTAKLRLERLSNELFNTKNIYGIFNSSKFIALANLENSLEGLFNSIKYLDYLILGGACYIEDIPCEIEIISQNGKPKIVSSCNSKKSPTQQVSDQSEKKKVIVGSEEYYKEFEDTITNHRNRVKQLQDANAICN